MKTVLPKKSLGQHFLTDTLIAKKIADTLLDYSFVPVLEVGAGTGALTRFLLENNYDLFVIEIDRESIVYLKNHFPLPEERILNADFLKTDLHSLFPDSFCIIGNYPYHISTQILFKLLDHKDQIPCCCGMFQKEVAERMASAHGKKTYGITSVLLQAWYRIEYLFTVDEQAFDPPPKVKSAVVRLVRNERKDLGCDPNWFKTIVKTAFNQRRKTLRNSLKSLINDHHLASLPIFDKRPEQLSVEDFIHLTKLICSLS